jgi:hypothetical protein
MVANALTLNTNFINKALNEFSDEDLLKRTSDLDFCRVLKSVQSVGLYQGEGKPHPYLGLDIPKPGSSMTLNNRATGPQ